MSKISLSANEKQRLYEAKLFKTSVMQSFWSPFMGTDTASAVQQKMDSKRKGERVQFGYRSRLDPSSVITNGDLEGNEDTLDYKYDEVILDNYRKAVRTDSELQEIQAYFDLPSDIESAIVDYQTELIDALIFKAVFSTTSATQYYVGGGSTLGGLTSSNKLSPDVLTELYALANTGKSRTYEPIRPIKIGGKNYFGLVAHPDVVADLRKDSDMKQSLENGWLRGESNPLFTAADLVYNNIMVFSDRRAPIGTSGSATYGRALLFGQQACVFAMGRMPKIIRKGFDYDDEMGIGTSVICGAKAPVFNGQRYGSILVNAFRSSVSGADNKSEIDYSKIVTANQG